MFSQLRPALVSLLLLSLLTGGVYSLAVQGFASAFFSRQANGSLLTDAQGNPVGSSLIGQGFDAPQYFWSRPSATGPVPYTAYNADKGTNGSGSNQGPTNPALVQAVTQRIAALKAVDPDNVRPIPLDLVTASASGLDPEISPAGAEYQVPRVARVRGITENEVRSLVAQATQGRQFGILGEPRVNVLLLNRALDKLAPQRQVP